MTYQSFVIPATFRTTSLRASMSYWVVMAMVFIRGDPPPWSAPKFAIPLCRSRPGRRHETFIFRVRGEFKSGSHNIVTRGEVFIVTTDLLTVIIKVPLHLAQTFKILLFCSHRVFSSFFSMFQTKTSPRDSATQAGFSCPSISIVWVVVMRTRPPCCSSTFARTILSRIFDPTATELRNLTLFRP